jgi:hypothetical protein
VKGALCTFQSFSVLQKNTITIIILVKNINLRAFKQIYLQKYFSSRSELFSVFNFIFFQMFSAHGSSSWMVKYPGKLVESPIQKEVKQEEVEQRSANAPQQRSIDALEVIPPGCVSFSFFIHLRMICNCNQIPQFFLCFF